MPTNKGGNTYGQPRRAAKVGVIFMGLSLALWIALPVVPFLPFTAAVRATIAGSLVIVAEITFWGGAALAGPVAARRIKSWWKARPT